MLRLLLVCLISLAAAVAVGLAGAALTRDLYVPLLTAVALGALAGAALGFLIHFFRVEAKSAVITLAVLVSLVCLGSFHWGEYQWHFKPQVRIQTQLAGLNTVTYNDTDAEQLVAEFLSEQVGQTGFMGFLKYRFESGVGLRFFNQDIASRAATAFFWLLDFAVMMAVVFRLCLGARARIDPRTN
jgi:hypothetical protein